MVSKPTIYIGAMHIIGMAVVSFFLWLTITSVDMRWAQAEVILHWALPVTGLLSVGLLLLENKKNVHVSYLDALLLVWGLYYFLRLYIKSDYPCSSQVIRDIAMFSLYFLLRPMGILKEISPLFIAAIIILCGIYESLSGLFQWYSETSRHGFYLPTGTFLNPGPFSAYPLIALVIGITARTHLLAFTAKIPTKMCQCANALFYASLAIMVVALFATVSRAAVISFFVILAFVYRRIYWRHRFFVLGIAVITCLILYYIKHGSADGRWLIWHASLTAWWHNPLTGVGIGGFHKACADGMSAMYVSCANSALFTYGNVAEYAFCDILKVIVEQGIVGMLLCVASLSLMLRQTYLWNTSLFYGIMSLLIFSLFSYPFELYPYRILLVLIASLASASPLFVQGCRKLYAMIFVCFLSVSSIFVGKETQARFHADKEIRLFSNMQKTSLIYDYYNNLPLEMDNPRFLFDFAKTLRKARRYNESNAMLRLGALVSNDPMFFVLQGNNYKDMQCYIYAEKAYKNAFSIMPNRMYPLYLLMHLHSETGNNKQAQRYASMIVAFREKVSSAATRQMRQEAQSFLTIKQGQKAIK